MRPKERIGDLCELQYGSALRSDRRLPGSVPVFGSNGVVGTHDRAITIGPTIVIGRKGSVGAVHWSKVPCYPIDTTYYIDSTRLPCDLKWLYYGLRDLDLPHLEKSAAVPGLNRDDVYDQTLPITGLKKQRQLAEILDHADHLRVLRRFNRQLTEDYLKSSFHAEIGDRIHLGPFVRLGDAATITGGGTPSRARPEFFKGTIPWATPKDMRGDYVRDTEEHITPEAIHSSATKLVPADSIFVVVKSKILLHRLPLAIAVVPMCHGQDIKSIQCGPGYHPEYLRFVIRSHEPRLLRMARGANTEGLNLEMLEELPIPDIAYSEQVRFAKLVGAGSDLARTQDESLRQAELLFEGMLRQAFSEPKSSPSPDSEEALER